MKNQGERNQTTLKYEEVLKFKKIFLKNHSIIHYQFEVRLLDRIKCTNVEYNFISILKINICPSLLHIYFKNNFDEYRHIIICILFF